MKDYVDPMDAFMVTMFYRYNNHKDKPNKWDTLFRPLLVMGGAPMVAVGVVLLKGGIKLGRYTRTKYISFNRSTLQKILDNQIAKDPNFINTEIGKSQFSERAMNERSVNMGKAEAAILEGGVSDNLRSQLKENQDKIKSFVDKQNTTLDEISDTLAEQDRILNQVSSEGAEKGDGGNPIIEGE